MIPRPVGASSFCVFVCDARPFDRTALRALLAAEGVAVAGESDDPADLLDEVHVSVGAVVLIGARVVRDRGAAAIDALHAANPRARVLVIGVDEATLAARARDAHADGYLCRDAELPTRLKRGLLP